MQKHTVQQELDRGGYEFPLQRIYNGGRERTRGWWCGRHGEVGRGQGSQARSRLSASSYTAFGIDVKKLLDLGPR
jgi:hypothetical protein